MEPDRSRRAQARHALTAHSGSQPEQASAGMRFTDTSIHQQAEAIVREGFTAVRIGVGNVQES